MSTSTKPQQAALKCYHCGEDCKNERIFISEKHFCCSGCKMVYEILHKHELCTYYDLNDNPGVSPENGIKDGKFDFLDEQHIKDQLSSFNDGKQTHITLYLPQIHCSSCLWLLEHVADINKGIVTSRIDFLKKEIFIIFNNEQTSLRAVAETLASIGYEPHLSLQNITAPKHIQPRNKLYKVGIAGFCFANIMMMSFPEYFALGSYLEKEIGKALHYFIFFLSLPVIFYCASEFFHSAWTGLRNKVLNIDLPIAVALAMTFLRSIYELGTGTGSGYLDSMSGIVFFMLMGRLAQDRTYRALSFDRDFKSFFPIAIHVRKNNVFKPVMVHELKVDDIIQIRTNEIIPVDAILSKGKATIDFSFVSGESIPVTKDIGELVYAGGKQLTGNIELVVVKEVSQSYLTSLWNKEVFQKEKTAASDINRLSKYFTLLVLLAGMLAGLYWFFQGETKLMWNALTTVLIVACPCSLLLSATFTNGNILRILSKNGLYLRHPDVIEALAKTNHIVFDKTGTITEREKVDIRYQGEPMSKEEEYRVGALLAQSAHPLSRIIYEHLGAFRHEEILSFREVSGQGIEGWIEDHHIKVGSAAFVQAKESIPGRQTPGSSVYIRVDNDIRGAYKISNHYRKGFSRMIGQLKTKFRLSLLSGDNNSEQSYLQSIFGREATVRFNQQPEQKLEYIRQLQEKQHSAVLMIGDGLNDAGALRQSNVGIALSDSINNFTPASDGILDAAQLERLPKFIRLAQNGQTIILFSFLLSIVYNIVGLYYAVQGTLSPLIAAILMPASSISIILLTYGLSERAARKHKLYANNHEQSRV